MDEEMSVRPAHGIFSLSTDEVSVCDPTGNRPLLGQYAFAIYSEYEFIVNNAKPFDSLA